MALPQDFVLSGLNENITSIAATIEKTQPQTIVCDAIANYNVSLSKILSTFTFQTDSFDLNDISSADIQYYVNSSDMSGALPTGWNPMVDTTVQIKSSGETWGRAGTTDSDGNVYANLSPSADYQRHLAWILFGTHFGVDLFSNETTIMNHLISSSQGNVQTALNNASQMTNNNTSDTNLCRELMKQMFYTNASRFQNVSNTSSIQSLPFTSGDSISYRIIVSADANQADVTGVSNIRVSPEILTGLPDLKRLDKVYKIKFAIV
jgi:hypothetical protein